MSLQLYIRQDLFTGTKDWVINLLQHTVLSFCIISTQQTEYYSNTTGIINNRFRPQRNFKENKKKFYITVALTALLYGSENWTIKARDTRRITAEEVKYEGWNFNSGKYLFTTDTK